LEDKEKLLFESLDKEDIELAKKLLEEDPSLVRAENRLGQTPFWTASCMGLTSLVEFMLEEPCRSHLQHDKPDRGMRTALDAARAYNNDDVVDILEPVFEAGADSKKAASAHDDKQQVTPPPPPSPDNDIC